MSYLLLVHSIDNAISTSGCDSSVQNNLIDNAISTSGFDSNAQNNIIENAMSTRNLDSSTQNNIQEIEQDFNYNELSFEAISAKRMPCINCNRKVFCNSDVNWIDLFKSSNLNLYKEFIENRHNIFSRLHFILTCTNKMIISYNENLDDNSIISRYKSIIENKLFDEFKNIRSYILTRSILDINIVRNFLLEIERYFDELSNIDLFKLLFGVRPSVLLGKIFSKNNLVVEEFKQFMSQINIIFKRIHKYVLNLKQEFFKLEDDKYSIKYSYFLKECVLLKWMIEVERVYMFNNAKKFEKFNHMLIYSINTYYFLFEKIASIIEGLINVKSDYGLERLGLKKLPTRITNSISDSYKGYWFELRNKKKYLIKVFDLVSYNCLPPGLSTAYLNCRSCFENYGFVGLVKDSGNQFKYLFLSVEEEPTFNLSSYYLPSFENNIAQSLYFILYILKLIISLNIYRIELTPDLTFSVNTSNNEQWKFELNDIGYYNYNKNDVSLNNHIYLIYIIDGFIKNLKDQEISSFFENLKSTADKYKDSKNINVLINMIENKLKFL